MTTLLRKASLDRVSTSHRSDEQGRGPRENGVTEVQLRIVAKLKSKNLLYRVPYRDVSCPRPPPERIKLANHLDHQVQVLGGLEEFLVVKIYLTVDGTMLLHRALIGWLSYHLVVPHLMVYCCYGVHSSRRTGLRT